jgi:hypothetical protein
MVVIGFLAYTSCRPRRHEPVGRMILAPAPPLPPSGSGAFDGKSYRVRMHAITALAQVGLQYERHEYYLTDDAGNTVLVVCGLRPGANQWAWLAPIEPAGLLTPYRAATKRQGDKIEVDGVQAVVADLFRTTIRRVESPEKSELITGAVSYGFTAQHGQNLYLARWDHTNMALLRGKMVSGKEVAAAFAQRAREQ